MRLGIRQLCEFRALSAQSHGRRKLQQPPPPPRQSQQGMQPLKLSSPREVHPLVLQVVFKPLLDRLQGVKGAHQRVKQPCGKEGGAMTGAKGRRGC